MTIETDGHILSRHFRFDLIELFQKTSLVPSIYLNMVIKYLLMLWGIIIIVIIIMYIV